MSPAERRSTALGLIAAHEAPLRRTARRHSLCADDADDALQRALVILLSKAPAAPPELLVRWMHVVTRNEARAVRRARERLLGRAPVAEPALEALACERPGPEEIAERRDRASAAAEALATLKPQERRAIALQAAGLSYREIQDLTGWTYTKVNRCLAEGRARLRARAD